MLPVKDTMKNLEAVCFIMQKQMWKRLRLISADMYLNLQMTGQKKGHLFRRLGSRTKEIITNLIPFMET